MLASLLVLLNQAAPIIASQQPQRVAEKLYYAAPTFSCSKTVRKRQEAAFRKRYSTRISELERREDIIRGPDSGYIIASSLRCTRVTPTSGDEFHAAMERFDVMLTNLEHGIAQASDVAPPRSRP